MRSTILDLAVVLALSACAAPARQVVSEAPLQAAAPGAFGEPQVMGRAVEMQATAPPFAEPSAAGFAASVAAEERIVIQDANLSLVVPSPAEAVREISRMAEQMGGFVVRSNLFKTTFPDSGVTADRASITIRVPSERLDDALQRIKEGATEVRSESVSGQDVTQEYTDLQSRLRNLEAAEEQLLEIMSAADETEDVLRVFENLRQVRQEIEIIQGRIQYLSQAAALSAISVELIPDAAAQPLQIGGWRPEGTAKEAFTALLQALRFLGNAAIWGAICVLPIGLLLGLPGYLLGRTILRRRRAAKAEPSAS